MTSQLNLPGFSVACLHVCIYIYQSYYTVMILSFWTDTPGQKVQTQIRLLLEEQSDLGLHCLPFRLHRLDSLLYGRATQFKFESDYNQFFGCPNLGNLRYYRYIIHAAINKGANKTLGMLGLICVFVVGIWHKQVLSSLICLSKPSKGKINFVLRKVVIRQDKGNEVECPSRQRN